MLKNIRAWLTVKHSDKGQDLAEYALLIGLIALVVVAAVTFLGGEITAVFNRIGETIATWPIGGG